MSVRVTVEPLYEPVSRAEAKTWLRIDTDDTSQDAVVDMLIEAMRRHAETLTGRAFIQRTLQLVAKGWENPLVLPYPPLRSVSSVTYVDLDGATQTLATNQYVVHSWREPAVIVPEWNVTWPSHRSVIDAIRVTYIAGYAESGSPSEAATAQAGLPENLKLWMHARMATLYEHREQLVLSSIAKIPRDFADGLLDGLVVGSLFG